MKKLAAVLFGLVLIPLSFASADDWWKPDTSPVVVYIPRVEAPKPPSQVTMIAPIISPIKTPIGASTPEPLMIDFCQERGILPVTSDACWKAWSDYLTH
jgi:hypothetical protein